MTARLKKDSSTWKAHGLAKKYAEPVARKVKSKKDTKRWCIGRVGREHEWTEWTVWRYSLGFGEAITGFMDGTVFLERYCVNCKKEDNATGEINEQTTNAKK